METKYIFIRTLFLLQSAALIFLIMNYSQTSTLICTQPKQTLSCGCKENDIGKVFADMRDFSAHRELATNSTKIPVTRGKLSNCTLADIKRRPGVVLLTTTNLGFLDMTMNMLESIKRVGICVSTAIIAEDSNVYQYLQRRTKYDPAVRVVMTNSGESDSKEVLAKNRHLYFDLLKKRQGYVLTLLQEGFEVLFVDADTFWFRDPFPYFQGDFDLSMVNIVDPYPFRTPRSRYCAGFAYFKPTSVTIQFVKTWIEALKGKDVQDQIMMNRLLQADSPVHVNIKPQDKTIFPFGPLFYKQLAQKANYSTVVMHAASIHGHADKVKKFKSSNMWLINATSEELLVQKL